MLVPLADTAPPCYDVIAALHLKGACGCLDVCCCHCAVGCEHGRLRRALQVHAGDGHIRGWLRHVLLAVLLDAHARVSREITFLVGVVLSCICMLNT